MGEKYVINFDEAIIFKTNKNLHLYEKNYTTFKEAKNDLICYWDNLLLKSKQTLNAVEKLKVSDVHYF
ncbi:MAG: hypothetical protein PHE56_06725 [Bacteroidales bacterium]|nr:hypothetical protein [Bacteroidales bacterium]